MFLQPLVYFAAVFWAVAFVAFGLYVAFKRGAAPFTERIVGLIASLLVGAIGSGAMIAGFYVIEELI